MKKLIIMLMFGHSLFLSSCSRQKDTPTWVYWRDASNTLCVRYSIAVDTSTRIHREEIVSKLDSIRQKIHITVCRGTHSSVDYSWPEGRWKANLSFHFTK